MLSQRLLDKLYKHHKQNVERYEMVKKLNSDDLKYIYGQSVVDKLNNFRKKFNQKYNAYEKYLFINLFTNICTYNYKRSIEQRTTTTTTTQQEENSMVVESIESTETMNCDNENGNESDNGTECDISIDYADCNQKIFNDKCFKYYGDIDMCFNIEKLYSKREHYSQNKYKERICIIINFTMLFMKQKYILFFLPILNDICAINLPIVDLRNIFRIFNETIKMIKENVNKIFLFRDNSCICELNDFILHLYGGNSDNISYYDILLRLKKFFNTLKYFQSIFGVEKIEKLGDNNIRKRHIFVINKSDIIMDACRFLGRNFITSNDFSNMVDLKKNILKELFCFDDNYEYDKIGKTISSFVQDTNIVNFNQHFLKEYYHKLCTLYKKLVNNDAYLFIHSDFRFTNNIKMLAPTYSAVYLNSEYKCIFCFKPTKSICNCSVFYTPISVLNLFRAKDNTVPSCESFMLDIFYNAVDSNYDDFYDETIPYPPYDSYFRGSKMLFDNISITMEQGERLVSPRALVLDEILTEILCYYYVCPHYNEYRIYYEKFVEFMINKNVIKRVEIYNPSEPIKYFKLNDLLKLFKIFMTECEELLEKTSRYECNGIILKEYLSKVEIADFNTAIYIAECESRDLNVIIESRRQLIEKHELFVKNYYFFIPGDFASTLNVFEKYKKFAEF